MRSLAIVILAAMLVLAGALWRLQVMAVQRYTRSEEAQSVRLVRVPAVRGRILDRNGIPLADNRPSFDVNLYLEELRPAFRFAYTNHSLPAYRAAHGGARPRGQDSIELQEHTRRMVYSNIVAAVSAGLGIPLNPSGDRFSRHYRQALALPLPVAENLTPEQMALFFERCRGVPGTDLEVQAVRHYPGGQLAAHVLGHLRRSDEAENDPEPLVFRYRLPDYAGVAGIEGSFDEYLRGRAGVKAIRVNSQGYRHEESILQPTEAGRDVRLTLDAGIQAAAERAIRRVAGETTRGAVIVMDVRNGDLLAVVSSPAFDPGDFLGGMTHEQYARLNDEKLRPQMNRAISGAYAPGSIFKIVVGLAAMEAGVLDPNARHDYLGYWPMPGRRPINDTAPAGSYDFKRAFKRSSNAYFIDHGLKTGRARIVAMSRRLGLGERTGIELGPEAPGLLPDDEFVARQRRRRDAWTDGDTANLSIGQGALTTSPLQIAVLTAAIANGGYVLKPRLVMGVESGNGGFIQEIPPEVRMDSGINPRHLAVVRAAMLADVEESEGTGRAAAVPGFRVGGKTGTAEVKRGNVLVDQITWFAAFGPYESPRYAVVVVVESGTSGGGTAAPVARDVFTALRDRERAGTRLETRAAQPADAGAVLLEGAQGGPGAALVDRTGWRGMHGGGG